MYFQETVSCFRLMLGSLKPGGCETWRTDKKTSEFEHGVLVSIVHTTLPNCTLCMLLQYKVHTSIIHSVYL